MGLRTWVGLASVVPGVVVDCGIPGMWHRRLWQAFRLDGSIDPEVSVGVEGRPSFDLMADGQTFELTVREKAWYIDWCCSA